MKNKADSDKHILQTSDIKINNLHEEIKDLKKSKSDLETLNDYNDDL